MNTRGNARQLQHAEPWGGRRIFSKLAPALVCLSPGRPNLTSLQLGIQSPSRAHHHCFCHDHGLFESISTAQQNFGPATARLNIAQAPLRSLFRIILAAFGNHVGFIFDSVWIPAGRFSDKSINSAANGS